MIEALRGLLVVLVALLGFPDAAHCAALGRKVASLPQVHCSRMHVYDYAQSIRAPTAWKADHSHHNDGSMARQLLDVLIPRVGVCRASVESSELVKATRGVASGAAHGIGFRSFEAFKRVVGAAGSNQQWHHIVEQTAGNVGRFGSTAVHNTGNLVRLETGVHRQISGFYSSIQPQVTGSSSLTVRQWLGGQTFEAQQDFGRQLLQQFGGL